MSDGWLDICILSTNAIDQSLTKNKSNDLGQCLTKYKNQDLGQSLTKNKSEDLGQRGPKKKSQDFECLFSKQTYDPHLEDQHYNVFMHS